MINLVVNHTHDEHLWFRAARCEGLSPKEWKYYVWNLQQITFFRVAVAGLREV